jgi:hypothetical protein
MKQGDFMAQALEASLPFEILFAPLEVRGSEIIKFFFGAS